jgi:hypothetical protein
MNNGQLSESFVKRIGKIAADGKIEKNLMSEIIHQFLGCV